MQKSKQFDKNTIIQLSKGKKLEYNTSTTWIDMFKTAASCYKDAIAVVDTQSRITYAELDNQSDAVAAFLKKTVLQRMNLWPLKWVGLKSFLLLCSE